MNFPVSESDIATDAIIHKLNIYDIKAHKHE